MQELIDVIRPLVVTLNSHRVSSFHVALQAVHARQVATIMALTKALELGAAGANGEAVEKLPCWTLWEFLRHLRNGLRELPVRGVHEGALVMRDHRLVGLLSHFERLGSVRQQDAR